jgi:hypothetical protein
MTRAIRWTRGTARVFSVPSGPVAAGGLFDHLALRPVTNTDTPSITAQMCTDDGAVIPTPIAGLATVTLTYDDANRRWAGVVPYASAFDGLTSARVVVTATISGSTARLMDVRVTFDEATGL